MLYHYLVFGTPVISDFEFPGLYPMEDLAFFENPIRIVNKTVPLVLKGPATVEHRFGSFNQDEVLMVFPGIVKFTFAMETG